MSLCKGRWHVWIDTGGTFTDCLALDPEGCLRETKVLSSSALRGSVEDILGERSLRVRLPSAIPPGLLEGFRFRILGAPGSEAIIRTHENGVLGLDAPVSASRGDSFEALSPEEAPVLAARIATGTPSTDPLPPMNMRLATTRGTNALLERGGARVVLFVTEGFGDLLRIGTQQRPDLFTLNIQRPMPLPEHIVEVPERIAADGAVLRPLDAASLGQTIRKLLNMGVRHAAVSLMHSYRNPAHEIELAEALHAAGFEHVACSSEIAPFIQLLTRTETTVVESYLYPVVGEYLARVQDSLAGGSLHVMTSAGGLTEASTFRAKDCLLSGPAGGVVGSALAGRLSGQERIISFDMGGTSTDVSRVDGDFEYVFESGVGDAHLVAPSLAIETVAAGGGSICTAEHGHLRVGPESAGARPGPACYGAGGPLTVTDVNLLLGRLQPKRFEIPISIARAEEALVGVRRSLEEQTGKREPSEALLEGFLEIANERMADAIRRVSLRRGYDPADYALVAFGGAGGQHACAVARQLGMDQVVVPARAGLLSALGLGYARMERFAERQVLRQLDEVEDELTGWLEELATDAVERVAAEGIPAERIEIRRRIARLRFAGQDSALDVELEDPIPLRQAFERRYEEVFGHRPEGRPVELESLRVVASSEPGDVRIAPQAPAVGTEARPDGETDTYFTAWRKVPTFDRVTLPAGCAIPGPAIVFDAHSAVVVEEDWEATLDDARALLLTRRGRVTPMPRREREGASRRLEVRTREAAGSDPARPEAVQVELFAHRFTHLALEMGEQLRRTAISTNIKERRDYSCALLDTQGRLVVNAPHIPVHLGSLGLCMRALRGAVPMEPGDVIVTNHPSFGGSHLPDITVVTPVFLEETLLGYVASRAHHAELGGLAPGSMPSAARALAEEGVVIPPTHLVRRGDVNWDEIRELLTTAHKPTRALHDNLADLRAAVAANQRGVESLRTLARAHGTKAIAHYMEALERHAEERMHSALSKVRDGRYTATECLDDGSQIAVSITIRGDEAEIDFAGSAGIHPGNLNATEAVVRAAVIYLLRLLVNEPLPLNEGLMRAVTVKVPRGMLNPDFELPPDRAPAIVGGNVETSQRIVDTLLRALGLAACSQGTMNNVSFGDASFGYYETVCGGAGAGPGFHGADAVHTHMTNTRITDPEILEHRYPVRVERFAIRRGSGGRGRWRGGAGVVREMMFLRPMTLSLLSQHRAHGPYGLDGGNAGMPGRQTLHRMGGEVVTLGPVDGAEVSAGDRLVLETPGGGGYGAESECAGRAESE